MKHEGARGYAQSRPKSMFPINIEESYLDLDFGTLRKQVAKAIVGLKKAQSRPKSIFPINIEEDCLDDLGTLRFFFFFLNNRKSDYALC